jgi:hypothetical protein
MIILSDSRVGIRFPHLGHCIFLISVPRERTSPNSEKYAQSKNQASSHSFLFVQLCCLYVSVIHIQLSQCPRLIFSCVLFADVPQPFASLMSSCGTRAGFTLAPREIRSLRERRGTREARQTFTKPSLPNGEACRLGSRFVLPAHVMCNCGAV